MKKTFLALALAAGIASVAHADSQFALDFMTQNAIVTAEHAMQTNNLINWKVGEFTEFNMDSPMGNLGKLKKFVASEQGNNIWLQQDMSGMIGNHKVEALMDRATGQILELRQDGQKQEIPNDKLEIISQDQARITVPAGTFDTIHIKAKSEKIKSLEAWINPRDTALDGTVQNIVDAGMITITLKLTKFGGK